MLLSQIRMGGFLLMTEKPGYVHRCMLRRYKVGAPPLSGYSPKEPTPTL